MIAVSVDPRILPPKGLLLALAAQLPLLLCGWPLDPPAAMVIAVAALIVAGIVLNVWAERLFRRNRVGVCPFSTAPFWSTPGLTGSPATRCTWDSSV